MYCIFRETTQILTSNIMYAYTLWICIQPRKVVNQIIIQKIKSLKNFQLYGLMAYVYCILFHEYTSSIRSLLCYYMGSILMYYFLLPILLHCYCRNLIQNLQNNNELTKTNIINQIYNINFFNLSQICQRLCSKL